MVFDLFASRYLISRLSNIKIQKTGAVVTDFA
jgi:hypothetical protein